MFILLVLLTLFIFFGFDEFPESLDLLTHLLLLSLFGFALLTLELLPEHLLPAGVLVHGCRGFCLRYTLLLGGGELLEGIKLGSAFCFFLLKSLELLKHFQVLCVQSAEVSPALTIRPSRLI